MARMIKHVFTGNLNGCINSFPPFPGKERHLLRAQLARITHGTQICPKGYIEIDEESGAEKLAEEGGPDMSTGALADVGAWGHRYSSILKAGRCTHIPPDGMPEEALEEYLAK